MIPTSHMSLGIYIHLPYCVHHCVYCDFNVRELKSKKDLSWYLDALKKEIRSYGKRFGTSKEVDTIFLGGGTPSVYSAKQIGEIIVEIKSSFQVREPIEVTMEANPNSVTLSKLVDLREMGVNRLSLGIQSFHEKHLKTLERIHSQKQAVASIENAKRAGFEQLNIDLIFGIPNQTLDELKRDVETALSLNPSHLSTYHLTINSSNRLHPHLPEEAIPTDMFEWLISTVPMRGFEHYEVSAFAKPGAKSRHNLKYWRLEDFLGLGAGAYSRLRTSSCPWGLHLKNVSSLEAYVEQVLASGEAVEEKETVGLEIAQKDYLVTHLRLLEGISEENFVRRFGNSLMISYSKEISSLSEKGLVDSDGKMLKLTSRGVMLLNRVLVEFM